MIKPWQERVHELGYDSSELHEAVSAEIAELRAELDRVTTLSHGQHIELYNARLELSALKNQEPMATVVSNGDDDYSKVSRTYQAPLPIGTRLYVAPVQTKQLLEKFDYVPLSNAYIDTLGIRDLSDFPTIFQLVPWGSELKPYARKLARAIERAVRG